jgi:cytosine/adenosine deaminase-related metal-dependent hydrolase
MTSVPCPAGAKVQEGAGAIVVPGFVDIHAHWDGTAIFFIFALILIFEMMHYFTNTSKY